jgi:hypothetical protein
LSKGLRHGEFFYTAACCNWRGVCHCYGSATFVFVTEQFAALVLAVMGAIYAGFALQKGNLFQIPAEVAPSVVLLPISRREFGTMEGWELAPGSRKFVVISAC